MTADSSTRAARNCGPCSACCYALRIDVINKPAEVPCIHLRPGAGCSCYVTRPEPCARYKCLWIEGYLNDEDRPDTSGVVLHLGGTPDTGPFYTVFPAFPDAYLQPKTQAYIRALTDKHLCVIVSGDTRKVAGPPADVARFRTAMQGKLRVIQGH